MVRRRIDWAAIDDGLRALDYLATHAQLAELGLTSSTVMRRISPRGPWQRILPGVVLAHRGTPTRREQLRAAVAFCGPGCVITGVDALRARGLQLPVEETIDVLIPIGKHRASFGFVRVERTRRIPGPAEIDGLPYASPARAVIDACRRMRRLDGVRDLISKVVQKGFCSVDDLRKELRRAARQRTALSRLALSEISEGIRSVAEAKAREVLRAAGVRAPSWNVRLIRADGTTFLSPDAFWDDVAAAIEIDSFAWHLAPADYARTMRRSRQLMIEGVMVLSFSPNEIIDDPAGFVREVEALLRVAAGRPRPTGILVRSAAAA